MTPFERQLADTPLRDIPPSWRTRLLPPPRRPSFAWLPFWRRLLWPHPLAWGALATCWIIIMALNFSGPRGPELYAVSPPGTPAILNRASLLWYVWQLRHRELLWEEPSETPPTLDSSKL